MPACVYGFSARVGPTLDTDGSAGVRAVVAGSFGVGRDDGPVGTALAVEGGGGAAAGRGTYVVTGAGADVFRTGRVVGGSIGPRLRGQHDVAGERPAVLGLGFAAEAARVFRTGGHRQHLFGAGLEVLALARSGEMAGLELEAVELFLGPTYRLREGWDWTRGGDRSEK